MKNVEMKLEGNILVIRVDLTKDFGPSASGKTTIIASTEGNIPVTRSRGADRAERLPEEVNEVLPTSWTKQTP